MFAGRTNFTHLRTLGVKSFGRHMQSICFKTSSRNVVWDLQARFFTIDCIHKGSSKPSVPVTQKFCERWHCFSDMCIEVNIIGGRKVDNLNIPTLLTYKNMSNRCQILTAPGASHVRTLGTNKWLVQLIDVCIRGLPNGLHFFDELCPVIQTSHKIASTTKMWYQPNPLQI